MQMTVIVRNTDDPEQDDGDTIVRGED